MSQKNIQMDPAEIKDRASRIQKRTAEIDEFLTVVENKIRSINQHWEGRASEAYVEQFMKIKAMVKQSLEENLMSLSNAMTSIAEQIEEADQSLANGLSNISG